MAAHQTINNISSYISNDTGTFWNETNPGTLPTNVSISALVQDNSQVNLGLAIFFVLYTIIGVSGNIVVVLTICAKEELRKPSYIYILNVSIADFLLCAICGSFNAMIQFSGESHPACSFMGTVLTLTLIASIISLSAVAINRCHLLRLSQSRYNKLYSTMRIVLSLAIIWVISILCVSPLVFGYTRAGMDNRIRVCSAIVTDIYSYFYSVVIVLAIGFPCTIIIIISYTCIWRIFQESQSRQTKHKSQAHHKHIHESFRLSRNLFLISTTFVLCWLPEMVVIVIDYDAHLPAMVHYVTTLLALSHSVLHAILCITLNRNISHALRDVLPCVRSQQTLNPELKYAHKEEILPKSEQV